MRAFVVLALAAAGLGLQPGLSETPLPESHLSMPQQPAAADPWFTTCSIIALHPATGEFGVGVPSRAFGAGAAVPFAKPGVGADAQALRHAQAADTAAALQVGRHRHRPAACRLEGAGRRGPIFKDCTPVRNFDV